MTEESGDTYRRCDPSSLRAIRLLFKDNGLPSVRVTPVSRTEEGGRRGLIEQAGKQARADFALALTAENAVHYADDQRRKRVNGPR